MPNPYFQFKQFRIRHDRCAMKVCTDSCAFGAYLQPGPATRLLDIGTGSGLLALMLAQRTACPIDAVEIDEAAACQAAENAAASPWAGRIQVVRADILAYARTTPHRYDCIISNPPFFSRHLKRPHTTQNVAMHGDALQFAGLAKVVRTLLLPGGTFWSLLPPHEHTLLATHCHEQGLHPYRQATLHNHPGGPAIRVMSGFSFREAPALRTDSLIIRTAANEGYTPEFTRLMAPYYL